MVPVTVANAPDHRSESSHISAVSASRRSAGRKSAPVAFGTVRAQLPLAFAGQRIGLLGGSFNPPHAGHRLISEIAKRRLALDAVWWLVTPGNPLKSRHELAPLSERLALCRALAPEPWITFTTFEAELPSTFTAATLAFLRRRCPGVRFVWLMGADNLETFHRWRDWCGIASLCPIAVIDRPGHRLSAMASLAAHALDRRHMPEQAASKLATATPPAWTFLTGPLSSLSSTELRKRRESAHLSHKHKQ